MIACKICPWFSVWSRGLSVRLTSSPPAKLFRSESAAGLQQCCSASRPQQSSTGDTDGRYLGVKIIAVLLAQCRNPAHNVELSSGRKSPKHRLFQPTSKFKTRGESHVSSPEIYDGDFRRSAEGRYSTKSIGNVQTYLSAFDSLSGCPQ
jgi:hypothetical protein